MKQVSVLLVMAMFGAGSAFVLSALSGETTGYSIHAPIVIGSDSDFTIGNGVVAGSGTADDPYIIGGWEIPVSTGTGIMVSGTTAHFVIDGCHINGTASMGWPVQAITFLGVVNGNVKGCTFNMTSGVVQVQNSQDCSIYENEVLGCIGWAIVIESSSSVNVVNNYFMSQNGIQGTFWLESNVLLNRFEWNEECVSINECDNLRIQENYALSCGTFVSAGGCEYLLIHCNEVIAGSFGGIELSSVTQSEIRGNLIDGNAGSAIYAQNSNTLMIRDNLVNGSQIGGLVMVSVESSVIMGNVISNNSIGWGFTGGGITYVTCLNMTVYHNSFVDNSPAQAQDDRMEQNRWNTSYPEGGNYWSDHTGPDILMGPDQDVPGSDFIIDDPYLIDADSIDFYPLLYPIDFNSGPVAVATGDPLPANISLDITFDGSGSNHTNAPRRNVTEYKWDLDCDGRFETPGLADPEYVHRYARPGNYTVVLEVTDSEGLTDMTTLEVVVYEDEIPISEFAVAVLPVMALLAVVFIPKRSRSG